MCPVCADEHHERKVNYRLRWFLIYVCYHVIWEYLFPQSSSEDFVLSAEYSTGRFVVGSHSIFASIRDGYVIYSENLCTDVQCLSVTGST